MTTFKRLTFDATISKGCSGEFRIWVPKHILEQIPKDLWIVETVFIRYEDFKQSLKAHPLSKAGENKRYIPIYNSEIEGDYRSMGKVSIEMVVGCE